jgi:hypothetical protein
MVVVGSTARAVLGDEAVDVLEDGAAGMRRELLDLP